MKVTIEGIDTVIGKLTAIDTAIPPALAQQATLLASGTKEAWQGATPRRSNRLADAELVPPEGLGFTGENAIHYYPFVNDGHSTPRFFRGHPAHHISQVPGKHMTDKATQFIDDNLVPYMSKFLDGM